MGSIYWAPWAKVYWRNMHAGVFHEVPVILCLRTWRYQGK